MTGVHVRKLYSRFYYTVVIINIETIVYHRYIDTVYFQAAFIPTNCSLQITNVVRFIPLRQLVTGAVVPLYHALNIATVYHSQNNFPFLNTPLPCHLITVSHLVFRLA